MLKLIHIHVIDIFNHDYSLISQNIHSIIKVVSKIVKYKMKEIF
jgi:hypothetical protein